MKKCIKVILSIMVMIIIGSIFTISNATTPTQADIEKFVNEHSNLDPESITTEDVVAIYEDLSEQYTNEELADVLEKYSGELEKAGVNQDTIDTGAAILRTTSEKDLKKILENTDISELEAEIENAAENSNSGNVENSTFPSKTIWFMIQVLLANKIVKVSLFACFVIAIYMIIIRWIIYKKAGKHGWAAIVPIYRDVVWLKIAGISPWVLLLVLLPVIGWLILGIIFIVSKFTLPKQFGRSAGWGLGIWLLPIIFETVVAFSNKFKYKGKK